MESMEIFLDNTYELISFDGALVLSDWRHIAHCCIYSPNSFPTVSSYESKAYISMQMRFDGYLGFHGGIIDRSEGTDIVSGLNRELVEEINLDKKYFIMNKDHCISFTNKEKNQCYHFFTKEVSENNFQEIERNALNAKDYGKEVLGVIRVPLFTMKDGIGGFPIFLSNSFIGCAKYQLLNFLVKTKLMSYNDIKKCLSKSLL